MTALDFIRIDAPALLTAVLASLCCAILGNFLVLRRQSMLGDAISHSVLPGIVAAFVLVGTRGIIPMMGGSLVAAAIAALLIEAVRKIGRVESGASMGVIFTVMFAIGLVMMERAAAHTVDLDPDCVLYGQLEDILWLAPNSWSDLTDPAVLATLPYELTTLGLLFIVTVLLLLVFYKELRITAFDPDLATSLGVPAWVFHYGLVFFVAFAAIASFEAVGSILVIALLVCPPATARMLTDRYGLQIVLSGLIGITAAVSGYVAAGFVPRWMGADWALNAAGMIAVMAGVFLLLAVFFAPFHGIVPRMLRHRAHARTLSV